MVHQIQFKIITHSNNTRELFIEEIPMSGLSKCRDPEHYFYGLSGNWEWSLRTADYWGDHFEIPLVHGHHPFHNVPIETTSLTDATRSTTKIQELGQATFNHFDRRYGIREINNTWRMVEGMSFRDAIQILNSKRLSLLSERLRRCTLAPCSLTRFDWLCRPHQRCSSKIIKPRYMRGCVCVCGNI